MEPDSLKVRSEYAESIDQLLIGWTTREELFELAKIIYGVLTQIDGHGDPMCAFAIHEQVRGRMLLPKSSPRYGQTMYYPELLEEFVSLDPQKIDLYTLQTTFRALAIMLLTYDRRIRRLFLCEHAWHDKCKMQPPTFEDAFTFLHVESGIQPDCMKFMMLLRNSSLSVESERVITQEFLSEVIRLKKIGGRPINSVPIPPLDPVDAMDIDYYPE